MSTEPGAIQDCLEALLPDVEAGAAAKADARNRIDALFRPCWGFHTVWLGSDHRRQPYK